MAQMSTLLAAIDTKITALGLVQSPLIMDARNIPSTGLDRMYSLDLQTSNTGKDRDKWGGQMRLAHTLKVRMACVIRPTDQFTSQKEALDIEEGVIGVLMNPSNFPAYRIVFTGASRSLSQSREYIFVELIFNIEGTYLIPEGD